MADKTPPEVYTGPIPVAGYPPNTQSPAPSHPDLYNNMGQQPHTSPSPPAQAYTPGQESQYPYAPSNYPQSQYGPPSTYGAPSSYGAPGYAAPGYGAPQPPQNAYPGYGAPQTQSMYGAPPGAPGAPGVPQAMAAPPAVVTPPKKSNAGLKICGLPRAIFWIVLLSAIILVLGAIGAGLGVGLSNLNKGNSSSSSNTSSSTDPDDDNDNDVSTTRRLIPTPTTTGSNIPTSSGTPTNDLRVTGTATSSNIQCPQDDHKYFEVQSGSLFRVFCDMYLGATFIKNTTATNMGSCMNACQADSVCIGVIYYFSESIPDNCDMYRFIDDTEVYTNTDANIAFGAYDFAFT